MRDARTNILRTQPALVLVTSAPFRYTRNPLYLAAIGMYLGVSLWLGGVAPFVLLLPMIVALALRHRAGDVFLGLALLFGAQVLTGAREASAARRWVQLAGILCLLGVVGPLVGRMRLQLVGVAGYAVALPVAAFALAKWFRAGAPTHSLPAA